MRSVEMTGDGFSSVEMTNPFIVISSGAVHVPCHFERSEA